MILLNNWSRRITVILVVGAVGLAILERGLFAVAAVDAVNATPIPLPSKEKQALKVLEDAQARLKLAQEQLRIAQENYDKAKAANSTVAIRQQLQSLTWVFLDVDVTKKTITLMTADYRTDDLRGREVVPGTYIDSTFLTLFMEKDLKVFVDGREGKTTDLEKGMLISLRLALGQPDVSRIDATSKKPIRRHVLTEVDVKKKTISVTIDGRIPLAAHSADGAKLEIGDGGGKFEDLRPGMRVGLALSAQNGRIVVNRIIAHE